MSYILLVNPIVLGFPHTDVPKQDVLVGTAIASALACAICGLLGRLPMALAPGLGLSAYFAFGVVQRAGVSTNMAFTCGVVAGVIQVVFALTQFSLFIMQLIPKAVKQATVVGMGLLLTLIALHSVHIVVPASDGGLVQLGPLYSRDVVGTWMGLLLLATLTYYDVRGGVLLSMGLITVMVWFLDGWPGNIFSVPALSAFPRGLDFAHFSFQTHFPPLLAFAFVGIFDISGVLFGLASLAQIKDTKGEIPGSFWAFLAGGIGTIVSCMMGSSPVIIHVESAAGIRAGARTGVSSLVVSCWFLLSLFVSELVEHIPSVGNCSCVDFGW